MENQSLLQRGNEPDVYAERTKLNIRDTDGTLIFVSSLPLPPDITDGTHLTIFWVNRQKKPHYIVDLSVAEMQPVFTWINAHAISTLNIAGSRESQCRDIYRNTYQFLERFFSTFGCFSTPDSPEK